MPKRYAINAHAVGSNDQQVIIGAPTAALDPEGAMIHAAWLILIALQLNPELPDIQTFIHCALTDNPIPYHRSQP